MSLIMLQAPTAVDQVEPGSVQNLGPDCQVVCQVTRVRVRVDQMVHKVRVDQMVHEVRVDQMVQEVFMCCCVLQPVAAHLALCRL